MTVGEVATAQGPRLRLEAITDTDFHTDYRVVHTMTGKTLGEVVQTIDGWAFLCPQMDCLEDCYNSSSTPEAAAVALNAHDLNHVLERICEAMGGKDLRVPDFDNHYLCNFCYKVPATAIRNGEPWCEKCP